MLHVLRKKEYTAGFSSKVESMTIEEGNYIIKHLWHTEVINLILKKT